MTYIVQRQDRYYVVAYDDLDPLTGKERRRWHPVGHDRDEAEAIARRLNRDRTMKPEATNGQITLQAFLTETWLPRKRREVRATTAYRYAWFVEHYIAPAIGDVALRRLRAHHLEDLYQQLSTNGGRRGDGLAPKTIIEVHMIIRAALALAVRRELIEHSVAQSEQIKLVRTHSTTARSWTAAELASFLGIARSHRLYPALHLAAHTGMRRGEVVGLKWSDLDATRRRLSIQRTLQCVGGRPVEFGVKTRTSRRCVDLDDTTVDVLLTWRRQLRRDGLPAGVDDWIFCNTKGRYLHPESISQLFGRTVRERRSRASASTIMPTSAQPRPPTHPTRRCSSPPASRSRS